MEPSDNLGEAERAEWDRLLPVLGDAATPLHQGMIEIVCALQVDARKYWTRLEAEGVIIRAPNGRLQLNPVLDILLDNLEGMGDHLEVFVEIDHNGQAGRN